MSSDRSFNRFAFNRRALGALVAGVAFAALSGASAVAGDLKEVAIDFATYNPLSLIIKEQGWLEAELGDDVTVEWVQSAGSNKANEAHQAAQVNLRLSRSALAACNYNASRAYYDHYVALTQVEEAALAALKQE